MAIGIARATGGSTPPDGVPSVFGRYLLLRRLSRGGMGEIFLSRIGEMQGFEKLCIIKKVLPDLAADEEFIRRFIAEAQIAVQLQHANIASVYEVGRVQISGDRPDYFLAIEYVEGRDLRRTLARCFDLQLRLPPQLALFIVCEIAKGLAYAHRRTDDTGKELGIVHCDVSPPNVMLSLEGEVKVIDFGIARSRAQPSDGDPKVGFGKFGYMAPEQLIRGRAIDRRTDVYAAGVLLWELLTGERLFSFKPGYPLRDIARTIAQGGVAAPSTRTSGLDSDLDAIVLRALAPDPRDRFQIAEDLRDAVQRKLYQIDPAFSGDVLASFVKQLFEDEIEEQRAFLKATGIRDLTPYLEELSAAEMGTLSFARSIEGQSFVGPLPSRPVPTPAPLRASTEPVKERRFHSATQMIHRTPERRLGRLGALAAGVVMLGGGAVVYALRAPNPRVPSPPPPATPVAVVEPLALPPVVADPPPATRPGAEPARPARATPRPRAPERPAPAPRPGRNPAEVEARFRAMRGDYEAFKRSYGGRLDVQWKALMETAVYGKGDERYGKLDAQMGELRREMTRVRGEEQPGPDPRRPVIYRLIRPLLFRLDPEDAHHLVMARLAGFSRHPTACRLLDRALRVEAPALEVEAFGLRFANPVGLAAGLDKHGEAVRALGALGFGAVEVGSITALAQPGNPRPRMFRLREHRALVNRMGFNSVGAEAAARNLEVSAPALDRAARRFAVGVNLGRSKVTPNERAAEDYCASVDRLHRHADYFVVNVSSPNTPGLRDLQRREPLTALLRTVRERVLSLGGERPPPVLVKLAPDLSSEELDDALAAATDAGVAGLIVSNTTLDRSAVAGHPHAAEAGGLSGAPLRAPSTAIATVRARTGLPIIGVGGIDSAEAAYEKVRAGATLVQIYTGFIYEGPTLVRRINRGLLRLLRRDGFTRLTEAVG